MTSKTSPMSLKELLHHDNATVHSALSIREFLVKKNIATIPHSPCSPDLALCYFYLLPKLRLKLKGYYFRTMEKHNNFN